MIASFSLAQPAVTVLGIGVLVAVLAVLRSRARGVAAPALPVPGSSAEDAQVPETDVQPDGSGQSAFALQPASSVSIAFVAAPAAALVAGSMLAAFGSPVAHGLLLIAGLAVVTAISAQYRRTLLGKLDAATSRTCALGRGAALVCLLLIISRPGCDWTESVWERPLLVGLLDSSRSMSISDGSGPSRADLATNAMQAAVRAVPNLEDRYELQLRAFGAGVSPLDEWKIKPTEPASGIAAALRAAMQMRSPIGDGPAVVLLVSDGAETGASPGQIAAAAADLAARDVALVCLAVGPNASRAASVQMDPLVVPSRVGSRETLSIPVAAQVEDCGGSQLRIQAGWDGGFSVDETRAIRDSSQRIQQGLQLTPPSEGVHRLTVRASLPAELGGQCAEQSAVIQVRDERIRVLFVDGQLRSESAFAARALRTDPAFDVSQQVLLAKAGETDRAPAWREFDVVVLGNIDPKAISRDALADLAEATQRQGVGVLLAGGDRFFGDRTFARSDLAAISPVELSGCAAVDASVVDLVLSDVGARHAALPPRKPAAERLANPPTGTAPLIPQVSISIRFGNPKPLAETLLRTPDQAPALVVANVGRGRCAAAAWDETWPWALRSDEGFAGHRQLWRGLPRWLSAWVITDRADYTRSSLVGGQETVAVRAGIAGLDAGAPPPQFVRLLMRRAEESTTAPSSGAAGGAIGTRIRVVRTGEEWHAQLAAADWPGGSPRAGAYELEFSAEAGDQPVGATPRAGDIATGKTLFHVLADDPELRSPTFNFAVLQSAATATASHGGSFHAVSEATAVWRELTKADRRRRVERVARFDFAERMSWLLLALTTAGLGGDWLLRKRNGLR
ncbi:MAG: VWA domain-containing protein [Planctomycetes bacterium]|nr:VWA domain-containing protein [Planctomycetota bacterium]